MLPYIENVLVEIGDVVTATAPASGKAAELTVVGYAVTPDEAGEGATMTYAGYAALTPEALSSLGSEERYRLYKMLKLRAVIRIDGTLDIRGTFVEDHEVSECEVSSSWSLWAPAALCATLLQKRS